MTQIFLIFLLAQQSFTAELSNYFEKIKDKSTLEKIEGAVEFFKDTPSGLDPLGEGAGVDSDPLFSTKIFDCTTYVETLLAIGLSKTYPEIQKNLNKLRYQNGLPDYFQRNHFMVSEWIPENTKKGFVINITESLTPDAGAFRFAKRQLNKTIWFFHRVIDLLEKQKKSSDEILAQLKIVPHQSNRMEQTKFLKAEVLRADKGVIFEKLPPVSIIMFIRNIPTSPTLVSHMGFLIKRDSKLILSHAPQAKPWRLQTLPIEDYLTDMDSHRAPVEGVLILKIEGS